MSYLRAGRWSLPAPQAKERLKGGHGLSAPVVAEYELIKVDLQLCTTDSMVRPHEPGLMHALDRIVGR